ncbi:mechanosensitive ion channel family protein [Paenalkalicoccus suaedae]|uniref:Mechanosensitive ion channel family protein n=1 Tax=Paenalkalicoccus suaedae TaxID=2592382 RepID=A0A859FEI6_9BACI|nr:mechanosensitive ion channel family protein [Paenalkalicoccus suaedae]QKS71589.1 mechanosensitive ion channel family protein [Paenalkalicoccus suaedae]
MEEVAQQFSWQELLIAVGIFFLFLVFRKLFTTYVFKMIVSLSRKIPTDLITNILLAFERPMRSFMVFIGLFIAFVYFPLPDTYQAIFTQIFRSIIIVHVAWGLFNLASSSSSILTSVGKRFDVAEDDILMPFVSKLIRFAIVAMGLSIVLSEWGFEVGGFVAGLGLGGLAFALAAQESLGNFFGGVVIITEKPFAVGDWISTPSVEGIVEDINFRSTLVRTFSDSLITVPNSTLSNEPIENWSQMGKRRVSFNLGVEYGTPVARLRSLMTKLDTYLRNHEDVDQELIMVKFSEFQDSSLEILVYYFTKPTGWVDHLNIKESINIAIIHMLEEEDVKIAFPTSTLHVENDDEIAFLNDLEKNTQQSKENDE